jgi:ribosomal protein S3
VIEVLAETTPDNTDLSSIDLETVDGRNVVTVRTRTPGLLIGRRGATADTIRAAMAERLRDPALQVNVSEVRPPEPPLAPPSGVREPRDPLPDAPSTSTAIGEPDGM